MRFIAEDYGPQARVDIELGDLITLFVGPNNTGKTFVSRAIYGVLKSCRERECDINKLATLLLNTNIASEHDLLFVSREFCGKFSLMLENKDPRFMIRVSYDKTKREPLVTEIVGEVEPLSSLYVPAYRMVSLGLPYVFAGYALELKDVMLKLAFQIAAAFEGVEKKEAHTFRVSSIGFDSDLLYVFTRSLLSMLKPMLEQKQDILKAITIALSPTLLDLAIAIRAVEKIGVNERLKRMFRDLFPKFPYKALGLYHGDKAEALEIPPYLLSSGMMQTLPILCLLNLALIHLEHGYKRVFVFIDEPEINLELIRQTRFSEVIMDFIYSLYREGKKISLIIATHSDFIAYSITRWLARNDLRNLAKIYEFKHDGVEERDIDEYGEVELETFSKAVRKMFFEEELREG